MKPQNPSFALTRGERAHEEGNDWDTRGVTHRGCASGRDDTAVTSDTLPLGLCCMWRGGAGEEGSTGRAIFTCREAV